VTTRKKSSRPKSRRSSREPEVLTILKTDHKNVQKLFRDFERLSEDDEDEKEQIVSRACSELSAHANMEEEIVYPAIREVLTDGEVMDEAEVEHASAKQLISELERMSPGDRLYDATFKVLGEYVKHHVKEEEGEMFRQAKRARLDGDALAEQVAEHKGTMSSAMEERHSEGRRGRSRTRSGSRKR
jgi:hemerythrin-like domain-containing protein